MRIVDNKVFFWKGIFSNWHKCKFIYLNKEFNCGEQAMMYSKAIVFNDIETAEKILLTESPKEQKFLGRQVKLYKDEYWKKVREEIITNILLAKFRQNPELRKELLKYKGFEFVEASPFDKIWGIGLSEEDNKILDKNNWKGLNLLGKCLTEVCNILSKE